jgi:choline kinase
MTGIILAAGIASRLRPLTNDTPKCLLPVGGAALLERTLRSLEHSGITECVIVTGYYHEKVEKFASALNLSMKLHFRFNSHFAFTNNNYSLWMAGQAAAGQDILLLDADILFDRRLLPLLLQAPHENALIMRASGKLGHEEIKLEVDGSGRIVRIGKEIDPEGAVGESLGIEKFGASTAIRLFEILGNRKERNEFYEASFQEMIDGGCPVYVVDSGAYGCMEIDTPEDLAAARRLAPTLLP